MLYIIQNVLFTVLVILSYSMPVGQTTMNGKVNYKDTTYNGEIFTKMELEYLQMASSVLLMQNYQKAKDGWDGIIPNHNILTLFLSFLW